MNITKVLLLLFVLLLSARVWAQKDTANSNKVTVFDNSPSTTYRQQKQATKAKTVIKINPLLFFDGDIPIYFERAVGKSLSVEVAPGITYDNFSQDLWESASDGDGTGLFETPLQDVDGSTAGIGYSFKADVKYFPGTNNLLDGIYISPEFGYRHYVINYPTASVASAGPGTNFETGHANKAEFKLLLGHEAESDWIDNLFFDWYVGIGVRNTSALQYIPNSSNPTINADNESFTKPAFYFGIKIGIGF